MKRKFKEHHLFEFMDLPWLNKSLRQVLREILDFGNSAPFRSYYTFVAKQVVQVCEKWNCTEVYELGAGTAPMSRHIRQQPNAKSLRLLPCDLNPDLEIFHQLKSGSNGQIDPIFTPVDYTTDFMVNRNQQNSLLLFSATLHHLKFDERTNLISHLLPNCRGIVISEPLHKSLSSMVFVFLSLLPAILLPLAHIRHPGRMKRFLWCWLIPVGPLFFLWDGLISAWREWSVQERNQALFVDLQLNPKDVSIQRTLFSEIIFIQNPRFNLKMTDQ